MSIRRARLPFEGQYVQIPNTWMRDRRLSLRARGLLAEIMTHSEGWEITLGSLWRNAPEGREAIRKALLELVAAGYLRRDQDRGEHGRFGEINYVLTAPDLTVFQKLENGPITGVRSTAFQESAHKEEHLEEEQLKKGGAEAPQPAPRPDPWCKRHASTEGTDRPCVACGKAREAHNAWELDLVAASRSEQWTSKPGKSKYDPTVYCEHLNLIGQCETCDIEAARAAHVLQQQFGDRA